MNATLVQAAGQGTYTCSMPLTTETLGATSVTGDLNIEVTGIRFVGGVWYVQPVGAALSKASAFPEPGTGVYTALSGSFDQVL